MKPEKMKELLTAEEKELYGDAINCIKNQLSKVPIAKKTKVALESLVATRADNQALREMLGKHKWCQRKCVCKKDDYWISYCSECDAELPDHKPDCALAALLKEPK
jgi:hypothetical protein